MYFAISPESATLNDSNTHLMNFYNVLRDDPVALYKFFSSIDRTKSAYSEVRSSFSREIDDFKRGSYFLYLNRNCFNGIFRTNNSGEFNVPFSSNRIPPYPTERQLCSAAERLRGVELLCLDFEEACMRSLKTASLVYLDPPYYVSGQRIFREYSGRPFSSMDFDRLDALLNQIDKRGSHFVLSYPDCARMRDVAARWKSTSIKVRRTIAAKVQFRGSQSELLVRNFI